MGLLDDAIREHLELKRLRGADPSEVARLEREALGPVRRGAAGPEDLAHAEELAPPPPFDAEHAAEQPLVDDSQTLIPGAPPSTLGQDTAEIDMRTVIGDELDEPGVTAEAAPEYAPSPAEPLDEEYVPRAEPVAGDRLHDGDDEADAGAEEYTPQAETEHPTAPPAEPEGEVEDVLEETPSFLQQTPEHDRLWFEQQPPRDFDFDK